MSFLFVNLRFFLADGELLSMEELMAFLESQSIRRPQMTTKHASTLLPCFREAVSAYGLPSRVCSEKGGENTDVATYMLIILTSSEGQAGEV